MQLRPATRTGVKPLIGLYSESGCGKTYSSLLLARGFVGAAGRIGMIDTESGRGSLYADVIPGGYEVLQMEAPFSPERYIEAMKAVEESGVAIGIIDSGSHEWEGIGGVLDMASELEQKSGKPGLHIWKAPKMAHNFWMRALLQSRLPWIICLRAKFKSRQGKDDRGKTVIIKDDFTTPIAADDFIFECTAHGEIMPDHGLHLTKCSHPVLRQCFPVDKPITLAHGQALAAWCAAGSAGPVSSTASPPPGASGPVSAPPISQPVASPPLPPRPPKTSETPEARRARWVAKCTEAGGGHESYALEWAVENGILLDTESLSDWPDSKLPKTKAEAVQILNAIAAKSGVSEITP